MYARVTQLEVDAVRLGMDEALALFTRETLPRLRAQPGYVGVYVLTTPEGKGVLISLWSSAEAAEASRTTGFYAEELAKYATLFRSPPGRERYEVALVDLPGVAAPA